MPCSVDHYRLLTQDCPPARGALPSPPTGFIVGAEGARRIRQQLNSGFTHSFWWLWRRRRRRHNERDGATRQQQPRLRYENDVVVVNQLLEEVERSLLPGRGPRQQRRRPKTSSSLSQPVDPPQTIRPLLRWKEERPDRVARGHRGGSI